MITGIATCTCILHCMASLGVDMDGDGGLEERFKEAAERMRQNTALVLSNEAKLELYSFFKQVHDSMVYKI